GKNSFERHRNRVSLVISRLEALSPLKILSRGYSVSRKLPQAVLLKTVNDILAGDTMETILADGRVISSVEQVEKSRGK
ncbi:MAG: exodeoxyribonuclease VII large subunit, partial [candidate division Zixibacteria bacterium]|nr:exodeoxyribonuclease VII large subunit [candidate division Zixibacteria bacterium]